MNEEAIKILAGRKALRSEGYNPDCLLLRPLYGFATYTRNGGEKAFDDWWKDIDIVHIRQNSDDPDDIWIFVDKENYSELFGKVGAS